MYFLFFLMWIIFNGRITVEIVILGLLVSTAVYWFICRFMDFSPKREIEYIKKSRYLIKYFGFLIKEIVMANFSTMRLVLSSSRVTEPVLVSFDIPFKSNTSKFLLANAITLTPGTITVSVEGDTFTVHCLDKTFADGIESSVFVNLLKKMED